MRPPAIDKPIKEEREDKFNRVSLADYVSKIILGSNPEESISIGICGEWGTGKTSFINLVKNRLQSEIKGILGTNLTIMEFNPWTYTTQVDLTKEFFSIFLKELSYQNTKCKKFKRPTLSFLRGLDFILKICGRFIPGYKLYTEILSYCLGTTGSKKGLSLQESKQSISKKLRIINHKFLVIIDDLDRSKAHSIRMIMQLVKSVADFPNVIYLLGYDENIVSTSLSSPSVDGREYLQKIINIQIDLPKIETSVLYNAICERFRKKSDKSGEHVKEVLEKCIFPFVKTLRDVNILFSRFDSKFTISENNTHPADLLAITLLEFKNPQVWGWVYNNRYELCDPIYPNYAPHMSELYKEAELPYKYFEMLLCFFHIFKIKECTL